VSAALAVFVGVACADTSADADVRVADAYMTQPAGDAPAALYFTVLNPGSVPDTLVSVATPAAERAELHRSMVHQGVMRMDPVTLPEVPAGGALRFAPGGYHVMLTGLVPDLQAGDSVRATVHLRRTGSLRVAARVVTYAELARALAEGASPGP